MSIFGTDPNQIPRNVDLGDTAYLNKSELFSDIEIKAIAKTKDGEAVSVFVYDTRKDSDGGAWRKRTQHTSWYNEGVSTTRGPRKEFPTVAVIVAENTKVTIYDGDDPTLPMWMVFNVTNDTWLKHWFSGAGVSAVEALNGVLVTGGAGLGTRLSVINFVSDSGYVSEMNFCYEHTAISTRNTKPVGLATGNKVIVNNICKDVAMTVLPNAPIDSATGLPIPTIAVSTEGGVSIIKDDGKVVDITWTGGSVCRGVGFTSNNEVYVNHDFSDAAGGRHLRVYDIPDSDIVEAGYTFIEKSKRLYRASTPLAPYAHPSSKAYNHLTGPGMDYHKGTFALGFESGYLSNWHGLSLVSENIENYSKGMSCYITGSFNTGWMVGHTRLATLSDTKEEAVTSTELITNGTFDTNFDNWPTNATTEVENGRLKLTSASGNPRAYQAITGLEIGKIYTVSLEVEGSANAYVSTNNTSNGWLTEISYNAAFPAGTKRTMSFVAPTSTVYVVLYVIGTGNTAYFDNVTMRAGELDHTPYYRGLQTIGTVYKTPVAEGADLVKYNNTTNASNYMVRHHVDDLQFGTGDFSISFWTYEDIVADHPIIYLGEQTPVVNPPNGIHLWINGSFVKLAVGASTYQQITEVPYNSWTKVDVVRTNGVIKTYINGVERHTWNNATSITPDICYVGRGYYNNISSNNGMALLRVSADALNVEQIEKAYFDEKALFLPGAQATLVGKGVTGNIYAADDPVWALSFDKDTDLLHVGTEAGRSVFQGLRRVDNTTDAVTKSISASNNMIVEE